MVTYLSLTDRLLRALGVPVLFVGSGRGGWLLQRSAVVALWSFQVVSGSRRRCAVWRGSLYGVGMSGGLLASIVLLGCL